MPVADTNATVLHCSHIFTRLQGCSSWYNRHDMSLTTFLFQVTLQIPAKLYSYMQLRIIITNIVFSILASAYSYVNVHINNHTIVHLQTGTRSQKFKITKFVKFLCFAHLRSYTFSSCTNSILVATHLDCFPYLYNSGKMECLSHTVSEHIRTYLAKHDQEGYIPVSQQGVLVWQHTMQYLHISHVHR